MDALEQSATCVGMEFRMVVAEVDVAEVLEELHDVDAAAMLRLNVFCVDMM